MKLRLRSPSCIFCLALGLVFALANVWALWSYYRQYVTVKEIERLGGNWSIAASSHSGFPEFVGKVLGDDIATRAVDRILAVDLSGSDVTDEELRIVARLSSLKVLNLSRTSITDAGLQHLKSLPNLYYLDLTGTKVTDAGVNDLKSMLPTLDFRR